MDADLHSKDLAVSESISKGGFEGGLRGFLVGSGRRERKTDFRD